MRESELLSSGVEIDFDIGDLEISASREALQYTDRTKKAIVSTLEAIIKALPDALGEKFKECETLWDAKILYNDAFKHGGFGGKIKKIVDTKGITWNNRKIKSGIFDKQKWKDSDLELKIFSKPNHYNGNKRVKGQEAQNIYAKSNAIVIIDDAPTHHGRLNRIAPLIEDYEGRDKDTPLYETVYLLNYRSAKAQKEFLSERAFDFPAKKLTEYPKVVLRDIYPSNSQQYREGVQRSKTQNIAPRFSPWTRNALMANGTLAEVISLSRKRLILTMTKAFTFS